jgi:hypothetical protein
MSYGLKICFIFSFILSFAFLVTISSISLVQAEEKEQASLWPIPYYKGDIWSRPTLTGRFGLRTKLADKGITFSVDTIHTYQNIVDGGIDTGGEYGGSNDYIIHLDFGKMVALHRLAYSDFFSKTSGALS